jgi:hypothetical protein
VLRAADLWFPGDGTITAGSSAPSAGELAVFCRPVVTAPAAVRRDGRILADGWMPDFVRLGEMERHLGDGVIEAIAAAAVAKGRLKRRERRRLMSYPLVIRLMLAMGLMPGAWRAWRASATAVCRCCCEYGNGLGEAAVTSPWQPRSSRCARFWKPLA